MTSYILLIKDSVRQAAPIPPFSELILVKTELRNCRLREGGGKTMEDSVLLSSMFIKGTI